MEFCRETSPSAEVVLMGHVFFGGGSYRLLEFLFRERSYGVLWGYGLRALEP